MCLARAFPALPRIPLRGALALTGVVMLLDAMVPEPLRWTAATIVPFALVIVAAAQADVRGERTFWATPTMIRLGSWSFAFYLVHWLVLHYAHVALGGGQYSAPAAVGFLVAAFVVTLVLSSLLNHVVERPAMRRLGRPKSPTLQEDR
jgi:peptidoglycan/LPS O-acetylase OafA/YrhL